MQGQYFYKYCKISISNLAGVPSIVFGLLGYTLFVGAAGMGNSVLAAACNVIIDSSSYHRFKSRGY